MNKKRILLLLLLSVILFGGAFLFVFWYASITTPSHESAPTVPMSPEDSAANIKKANLACIAAMPIEKRLGQKLMAAGYAMQLQNETAAFAAASIGGVIVMDETLPEQITAFRQAMAITPFVAIDQEGGSVQRLKSTGDLPGATQMVANGSTALAHQQYVADNQLLKEYGVTTNFAPVVDVGSHAPNPLPGRMYSDDPSIVIDYATASITAAQKAGITPVIKHFPGLGSATGNTDFMTATIDPLSVLKSRDLIPYKKLASLHPDVMVGSMIVPDLTDGQPAIWSNDAIKLLRGMGYQDAVIYTDSLTAEGVPGSIKEAVLKSWLAGIDVALIVQADTDTPTLAVYFDSIIHYAVEAVQSNTLTTTSINESVLRIFERKQVHPCSL